jgi:Ser/Thr protein kinase RdoA (MazF antagonist)
MMAADPKSVLGRWPLAVSACSLAAERENIVYRIEDDRGSRFALRFHRPGYRSMAEIRSELDWMAELARARLHVPRPITSCQGVYIEEVEGQLVSVLTWLGGSPLGSVARPLEIEDRAGTFSRFGAAIARLHAISDRWSRPASFSRPAWDVDGLTGPEPYWGRFWENPALGPAGRKLVMAARDKARSVLQSDRVRLDFGLIHADLVRENVLLEGNDVKFIDFDDCGTGFRLFDLATALIKNMQEPDYPDLKRALLDGYGSVRPMEVDLLPVFLVLRAFTYLGWIIPRMNENGAAARNERNIAVAMALAREYVG